MDNDSDFLLRIITHSVPKHGVGLPVTLLVNGLVVSGTAIQAEEYYRRMTRELGESLGWEEGEAEQKESEASGTDWFSALSAVWNRLPKSEFDEPERGLFIYLQEATILGPGSQKIKVPTWRGRLSHVSGWNFGVLDFGE